MKSGNVVQLIVRNWPKRVRDFCPAIMVHGAMLVIALSLLMLYMLQRFQAERDFDSIQKETAPVGMASEADQQSIRCFIDDEEIINVPTATHNFSVRSEIGLSRPLCITSWNTTAALRNIKFMEI